MGKFLNQCPAIVQDQIKDITKSSGLSNDEESIESMAKAWIEKRDTFEERIVSMNMEETGSLSKDNANGALVLTYSGSLVSIGPLADGGRSVDYTSIDLRGDVPKSASDDNSELGKDIEIDKSVEFNRGPLKSSSPAFKIAVFKEEMTTEEEQENLNKATVILTDDFAKINKTIILE